MQCTRCKRFGDIKSTNRCFLSTKISSFETNSVVMRSSFNLNCSASVTNFSSVTCMESKEIESKGDCFAVDLCVSSGLIKIREEMLHFQPTFRLLSAFPMDYERPLGLVRKQFNFFRQQFVIESIYGVYSLESLDIFAHRYTLMKNGFMVATVNKQFFSLADSYGVEIVTEEDHAFVLAVVIVLDQIIFDQAEEKFF